MLKVIGAVLIIIASTGIGRLFACKLQQRQICLSQLQQGLLALEREVGFAATPLPQALNQAALAAGHGSVVFTAAADLLVNGEGLSAAEAFTQSIAENQLAISSTDRQILADLSSGLGLSDCDDQLKKIELIRLRLQSAESEAKEQYASWGKIWKNIGWSVGAVLVLMFI